MVHHVDPVADVLAVAIHRQWLVGQCPGDHQRDQFLRELVGPVIVGAPGEDRGDPEGMHVRPYQEIGSCLARRIRAVGSKGSRLGERRIVRSQVAEHLVRADVDEAEWPRALAQLRPHRLQQHQGAGDVGREEGLRTQDRTVHVRLGGEVYHGIDRGPVAGCPCGARRTAEESGYQFEVADVPVNELVAPLSPDAKRVLHVGQALEIPGVREEVEVDDPERGVLL